MQVNREESESHDARLRRPETYRSSTSRIFRTRVSEVNGLCGNAMPGLRTPCWTMASFVYPDMKITFSAGPWSTPVRWHPASRHRSGARPWTRPARTAQTLLPRLPRAAPRSLAVSIISSTAREAASWILLSVGLGRCTPDSIGAAATAMMGKHFRWWCS